LLIHANANALQESTLTDIEKACHAGCGSKSPIKLDSSEPSTFLWYTKTHVLDKPAQSQSMLAMPRYVDTNVRFLSNIPTSEVSAFHVSDEIMRESNLCLKKSRHSVLWGPTASSLAN
jgi:hypothetical protein